MERPDEHYSSRISDSSPSAGHIRTARLQAPALFLFHRPPSSLSLRPFRPLPATDRVVFSRLYSAQRACLPVTNPARDEMERKTDCGGECDMFTVKASTTDLGLKRLGRLAQRRQHGRYAGRESAVLVLVVEVRVRGHRAVQLLGVAASRRACWRVSGAVGAGAEARGRRRCVHAVRRRSWAGSQSPCALFSSRSF